MKNDFEIMRNRGWFEDTKQRQKDSKYISYRKVLCYAIFHSGPATREKNFREFVDKFEELRAGKIGHFKIENFMECYKFSPKTEEEKKEEIILIIDKTNGVFPLVLFPDEPNYRDDRIEAFRKAIISNAEENSVNQKLNEIIKIIESNENFGEISEKIDSLLYKNTN